MDYMGLDVHCPRKTIKLPHSLTLEITVFYTVLSDSNDPAMISK